MNNILDAIEKRSSTRGYTAEKLTDAELEKLLKAGLQAPATANKQEIHIPLSWTVTTRSWQRLMQKRMPR